MFSSRVIVIFVFTELLLCSVYTATSYTTQTPTTTFHSLNELQEWGNLSEMVKTFLDFRVWRIVQLCLLAIVYFYKLIIRDNDDEDNDY